jgi:hypothetical protein
LNGFAGIASGLVLPAVLRPLHRFFIRSFIRARCASRPLGIRAKAC